MSIRLVLWFSLPTRCLIRVSSLDIRQDSRTSICLRYNQVTCIYISEKRTELKREKMLMENIPSISLIPLFPTTPELMYHFNLSLNKKSCMTVEFKLSFRLSIFRFHWGFNTSLSWWTFFQRNMWLLPNLRMGSFSLFPPYYCYSEFWHLT